MNNLYDTIGLDYAQLRKPDRRIAAKIDVALGDARSVLNVGAGAGSYEPQGRDITAVEPSAEMIAQRGTSDAIVVQGSAEDLPFEDNSFDASMAVLTIHHWSDQRKGAAEMRRVTKGPVVFLTFDPGLNSFWLLDYFPELASLDDESMPAMGSYRTWLGPVDTTLVPVPHDCTDGFLAAYWRRPEAYLDPRVRAAMSSFWALGDITDQLSKLEADIRDGAWEDRYGHLLERTELDCGYRLVTTV